MKWFDTKEIRDESTLTPEQVTYLRQPSITFLGPFNILVRQHWDLIVLGIIGGIILNFCTALLLSHYIPLNSLVSISVGQISRSSGLLNFIYETPSGILELFILYFGIKYGRRLSWNRNYWKDFDDFEASEKKWKPWGWVGAILITVNLVYTIYFLIFG